MSAKLLVLVGVVGSLLLGVGLIGVVQLGAAQQRLKGMYRDSLQAILWLGIVSTDYQSMRVEMTNLALLGAKGHDAAVAAVLTLDADIAANWTAYAATDMTGRENARDSFNAGFDGFRTVRDTRLLPLAGMGRVAEYIAVRKAKILPLARQVETALADLRRIEQDAAQQSLDTAQHAYDTARTVILGMIVTAVLLALALACGVARMISRPLGRTVTVLEGLAGGRLDQRVAVTGRDEVGRMAVALDTALEQIGGTLREIDGNVDTLAGSADGLRAVAARMTGSAHRPASEADSASAIAEQAAIGAIIEQINNSQATIAAAVEEQTTTSEMSRNISEVATGSHANSASLGSVAQAATETTDAANDTARASDELSRIAGALRQSLTSFRL